MEKVTFIPDNRERNERATNQKVTTGLPMLLQSWSTNPIFSLDHFLIIAASNIMASAEAIKKK